MVDGFRTVFSQILTTFQPFSLSDRVTRRSLTTLRAIFCSQYARCAFGIRHFVGWPCQKQPSTNTATRAVGNTTSGFPWREYRRRHPVMPFSRKTVIRQASVERFPPDFTCAMIHERFCRLNVSIFSAAPTSGRHGGELASLPCTPLFADLLLHQLAWWSWALATPTRDLRAAFTEWSSSPDRTPADPLQLRPSPASPPGGLGRDRPAPPGADWRRARAAGW